MDYDKIFENDIDRSFFYTDYPGKKLVAGKISLDNALARLSKNEHYVLVTYQVGDELPEDYVPLPSLKSEDGTLFATVNSNTLFWNLCKDGGIQRVSRMPLDQDGSPNYLLGPGPATVTLDNLITEQYEELTKGNASSSRR